MRGRASQMTIVDNTSSQGSLQNEPGLLFNLETRLSPKRLGSINVLLECEIFLIISCCVSSQQWQLFTKVFMKKSQIVGRAAVACKLALRSVWELVCRTRLMLYVRLLWLYGRLLLCPYCSTTQQSVFAFRAGGIIIDLNGNEWWP